MSEPVILTEIDGAVAVVTLHRPESRNALNGALRHAIPEALMALDADPTVAAIILTGSDPAFCAGIDLRELSDAGSVASADASPLPFDAMSTPVIGAINGVTVTGGFELALGCDFLIASERARFADTHARVGVMPGWGLTVKLPQAIGIRRARQMSFTGNFVDAPTALEWGLVNAVVSHDQLIPTCKALAADIASIPAANLAGIKNAYRTSGAPHDDAALAAEIGYSNDWLRQFDPATLAASREAIQQRGRSQSES
ncbi:MAG TPA: enoyl-CoA hydratase [Ilumatobacter sp.]|nr:enoyl-CoA hydratase [Ilumatobacter sp.]